MKNKQKKISIRERNNKRTIQKHVLSRHINIFNILQGKSRTWSIPKYLPIVLYMDNFSNTFEPA